MQTVIQSEKVWIENYFHKIKLLNNSCWLCFQKMVQRNSAGFFCVKSHILKVINLYIFRNYTTLASVMINFMCQHNWAKRMWRLLVKHHFWVCLWRCLQERLAFAGVDWESNQPCQCWWAPSKALKARTGLKKEWKICSLWVGTCIFYAQTVKFLVLRSSDSNWITLQALLVLQLIDRVLLSPSSQLNLSLLQRKVAWVRESFLIHSHSFSLSPISFLSTENYN